MNWIYAAALLALLAGASGAFATAPPAPRHTGFDCLFPAGNQWIPCDRYKHLEARA